MNILTHRKRVTTIHYRAHYHFANDPDRGFSFDCDKDGVIDTANLAPAGMASLTECQAGFSGGARIIYDGIVRVERSYTEPAIGLCDCGEQVALSNFTNTCACGADYNTAGQLLAPRYQWGEETGESLSDILRY